ncbi:serine/threonine protein kinase [Sandaracinus amylolyticus]|uniref:Serine/threonine protein kinase n=1 Tax=Sandaracinus amylolyticus TaxID=927083 RepID=A0A0F6YGA0_9BACT|nr:serine/threonine-protein kinase [Sandaracinus amylolyticus]AKF04438.1 serine/threonine protein kinase [Sandaracinus amylolyticus]
MADLAMLPMSSVVDAVGPYRVLARLAAGGMSEILLARRAGVAGLERLVAVKRMLPETISEPQLRGALIDEARVLVGLRHPNVVAVQELGCEDEQLYLVMEYLRGDNLLALTRAAREHGIELDVALVVHIVAEICAGLHAAHELADDDGRSLDVVHRDVSPQNVFVTFEGEVKLIDFGIVRFADQIARTKSGVVKGKFAYMAPEQFSGEPLDRRIDVFATGVVLHELLTGRRLFARSNDRDMLMAILSDPVPRPSEAAPSRGIPRALDEICMRALARDRNDRFATAGEMRAALRALLPALDPRLDARETLSQLTRRVLASRLAEVDALLRRARRPTTDQFDRAAALGAVARTEPTAPLEIDVVVELDVEPVAQPRAQRPRAPMLRDPIAASVLPVVAATALLVLAALGISAMRPAHPRPQLPEFGAPGVTTTPAASPSDPPAVRSHAPETIRVSVHSEPAGAVVTVAGEARGVTPLALELPRGSASIDLALALDGHVTTRQTLLPDESQRLVVHLAPTCTGSR